MFFIKIDIHSYKFRSITIRLSNQRALFGNTKSICIWLKEMDGWIALMVPFDWMFHIHLPERVFFYESKNDSLCASCKSLLRYRRGLSRLAPIRKSSLRDLQFFSEKCIDNVSSQVLAISCCEDTCMNYDITFFKCSITKTMGPIVSHLDSSRRMLSTIIPLNK